ncbi:MAG: GNAT family N-acetyltransferase [Candidatus Eremiobacteraeota bacterium]|nr:GNAT family N-acetyltransferase [Candidatus Eremiobacteraeota bacterium]
MILSWFDLPHAAPFLRKPSGQQVQNALDHPHKALFVVEDQDGPVAHFSLLDVNGSRIVNLGIVLVAQPRRGYGRTSVEWAQQFAFEDSDAHRLWVEVTADNFAARALYESCGFIHEGTWRDGFPANDGTFKDLAAYGMLAREFRPPPGLY